MKQSVVYIGIDMAKAHLDVAWAGTFRRLPNERSGHAVLVRWIKQSATPVQLICEASGGYEQGVAREPGKERSKSHSGAGRACSSICAGGWHPGQDRPDGCKSACGFWQRDATAANPATLR